MAELQFLFKIDSISHDERPENRVGDNNWRPPRNPQAFRTTSLPGPWCRWTAGGISYAGSNIGSDDYDTCSLFYNNESSQFLGVPFDCRVFSVEDDARESGTGWSRLMFQHQTILYGGVRRPLSILRFHEEFHVLASGTNPYWMPQLLPTSFKWNDDNPQYNGGELHTCLAGSLSLFIALAAFSCPQQYMLQTIGSSFKPPRWIPHQFVEDSMFLLTRIILNGIGTSLHTSRKTRPWHGNIDPSRPLGTRYHTSGVGGIRKWEVWANNRLKRSPSEIEVRTWSLLSVCPPELK